MKSFLSLFKKEFSIFFTSNIIYFLIALYVFLSMICTFYFGAYFTSEDVNLKSFFTTQIYLLTIIIPAVTMRSWAEEKKSGSYEVTITYPIPFASHIWAKFLSSTTVILLMILVTIPFWIYSNNVMNLDNLTILSSYFGIILMAVVFCAVGCCVSALSSSVIFSYLFSVLVSWLLCNVDFNFLLKPLLFFTPDVYVQLQGELNLTHHLNAFLNGLVGLDDILFFVFLSLIFVLTNKIIIENKKPKQILWNGIYFSVVFLIFCFVSVFFSLALGKYKADMTSNQEYKLSDTTREIVKELPNKVEVKLFVSEQISDFYPEYAEYVDFVMNRLFAYERLSKGKIKINVRAVKNYSISEREAKENKLSSFITPNGETIIYFGAVFMDYEGNSFVIPNFTEARKDLLESDVSRILYKFSHKEAKKIAWIDASGENDFSDIKDFLEGDYQVTEISSRVTQISPYFDTVIVANFQDSSIFLTYALDQYLMSGGKILLFADNLNEYQTDMKDLSSYALEFLKNINLKFSETKVVVDESLASPVTIDDIKGNKRIIDDVLDINLRASNINQENAITKGLGLINFVSPSLITVTDKNDKLEIQSLLQTSETAGSINAGVAKATVSEYVGSYYDKDNQRYSLAYLLEGEGSSIFEKNILGASGYQANDVLPFIKVSVKPFKVVAVADTGVLKLKGYSLQGDEFSRYLVSEPNDNLRFVMRSVDYLAGNEQLLGLDNRLQLRNYQSLDVKISKQVKVKEISELENLRKEIYANDFQIKRIHKENQELSLAKTKDVEALNRINISLKEKLKMLEYQLNSKINAELSFIILFWTVVYPLCFILLLFFLMKIYYIMERKKIRELFNESKNI
ncbi:MAG: Gldg family protein [Alphaproteobacteria bacterium]